MIFVVDNNNRFSMVVGMQTKQSLKKVGPELYSLYNEETEKRRRNKKSPFNKPSPFDMSREASFRGIKYFIHHNVQKGTFGLVIAGTHRIGYVFTWLNDAQETATSIIDAVYVKRTHKF